MEENVTLQEFASCYSNVNVLMMISSLTRTASDTALTRQSIYCTFRRANNLPLAEYTLYPGLSIKKV
jgi:hypothetical protein